MPFARILRASLLMGGAQVVTLVAAFVRTKVIACLLGPSGVGLVGVLTAFNGNVSTLAGWGLGTAGVRMISAAGPEEKASKQALVLRFGFILSGIGLFVTLVSFWPVALLTFDSDRYAIELLLGGLAVPCIIATSAWSAILQAAGHVKSLAKAQMISALAGLLLGLPSIYFLGTLGISISLLLAAVAPMAFTWYIARGECLSDGHDDRLEDFRELFKMGAGLMVIGVAAQLSAYAIRLAIIRHHGNDWNSGLADAGYYQAAIAIAGSLPAMVFTSMGTDFFPRVAAAKDEGEAQELSEKQIQAALLLALPIFTGLITMSRLCITFLYAERFEPAEPLLIWMIWGVFVRLMGWPLGYWLVARGSMRTVVLVEVSSNLVMALLPILLMPGMGLAGSAVGYFIGYSLYAMTMLLVARKRCGVWLGATTLYCFAGATAVLLGSQAFSMSVNNAYWGLLPTAIVTAMVVIIYRRVLKSES